jgi:hypothetical protein
MKEINMKWQFLYRAVLLSSALLLLLTAAGCGNLPAATTEPTSLPEAATPTAASTQPEPSPTTEPKVDEDLLYYDDFTNPATAWTEEKFDNYFVGYHEPEFYHIEITSSN